MTRIRGLIAALWLLAFWLAAALVVAPRIERDLTAAAKAATQDLPTGYTEAEIRFDGQQAHLSGRVRWDSQRQQIQSVLKDQIRLPGWLGADWNPVSQVHDGMELSPYPPGWLMIAAHGPRGLLLGTAGTDFEARDLAVQIGGRWSENGGYLDNRLQADPARHDEAAEVRATLARIPLPRQNGGGDSAQIQVARIGGDWQRLVPEAKDDHLQKQVEALGLRSIDWEKAVLPAIQNVRRYQEDQRALAAEAERQSKLPPPHLLVACRDKRLLIRGEVATLSLKRELLNSFIDTLPEWRVLDDVRVNPQRRARADFGPITAALLPPENPKDPKTAGKSLFIGFPGSAWQELDVLAGSDTQPWKEVLPKDLPPALLNDDSRMVLEWLQGSAKGIPKLPVRLQPSFLTLTLTPEKVILAGQVAEESSRTQILEAARQKYAGRALVLAEGLLARGTCEPASDLEQTLRSLPALPEPGTPGLLAFARPGQVWKSLPAAEKLAQPGAVAASGLLPQEFPAAMAEDTFLEGFDHLRHHWKSLAEGARKEAAP